MDSRKSIAVRRRSSSATGGRSDCGGVILGLVIRASVVEIAGDGDEEGPGRIVPRGGERDVARGDGHRRKKRAAALSVSSLQLNPSLASAAPRSARCGGGTSKPQRTRPNAAP